MAAQDGSLVRTYRTLGSVLDVSWHRNGQKLAAAAGTVAFVWETKK